MLWNQSLSGSFSSFHHSDLEKSVEEIQKESSVNHKLLSAQELEEKTNVLRKLGETLTELKSESSWLASNLYTNAELNSVGHSWKRHIALQGTGDSSTASLSNCALSQFTAWRFTLKTRKFSFLDFVWHPFCADQFPGLQSKMRVVLRVEVEAVKFLKEEPHRLDALLKRCKTITDTLTAMRKYEPSSAESHSASGLLIFVCLWRNLWLKPNEIIFIGCLCNLPILQDCVITLGLIIPH